MAVLVAAYCSPGFSLGDFGYISARQVADRFADSGAAIPVVKEEKQSAAVSARKTKDWTVMVYMNGKSNVEPFALADMNKLEAAGSSDRVNVVVEMGRMRGQDNDTDADGDWIGVRRYYVARDNDPEKITSPVLMDLGRSDMGNWKNVAAFVKWTKANYPAEKYILVLWDHGWGWIDPPASWRENGSGGRSISHDFENQSYIKTTELKPLFETIGHLDVYASMACFMQMMEVAYEFKSSPDVIVGSEEVIQLASFDFEAIIAALSAKPGMNAEAAGKVFTKTFHSLYTRPDIADQLVQTKYGVQLSAIRAARLEGLAKLLDGWTELVRQADNAGALKAALNGVVRFEVGDDATDPQKLISPYADLYNFADLFADALPRDERYAPVRAKTAELLSYIRSALVIDNVYSSKDRTGKDYKNTHGIAITVPGMPGTLVDASNRYESLSFAQASSWGRFMEYLKLYR
ncbi:MAG: clostripain-related cysteine peptidase [Elusimicrobiaceae bacterium]|nr:clostripain-related cysteine peptidase [Elusimicrobiaceae bacterium]